MLTISSQSEQVSILDDVYSIQDLLRTRSEIFFVGTISAPDTFPLFLRCSLALDPAEVCLFQLANVYTPEKRDVYLYNVDQKVVLGGFFLRNKTKMEILSSVATTGPNVALYSQDFFRLKLEIVNAHGCLVGDATFTREIKIVRRFSPVKIYKCSKYFCHFSGGDEITFDTDTDMPLKLVITTEYENQMYIFDTLKQLGRQVTVKMPPFPGIVNCLKLKVFLQLQRADTDSLSEKLPFLYCHEHILDVMRLAFKQQADAPDNTISLPTKSLLTFAATRSLKELLASHDQLINATDAYGNTLLHLAIIFGNFDIFQMLLASSTNLSAIRNAGDQTPIELAVHFREFEYFQCLLKSQDIFYRDMNLNNLFHLTCLSGKYPIFKVKKKKYKQHKNICLHLFFHRCYSTTFPTDKTIRLR